MPTNLLLSANCWRGKSEVIRCDNGPEYVSAQIQDWAKDWGIKLEYIQPGKPQQNAYVERFNRTVRYEWLSQYHWETIDEVQLYATQWMWKYNHDRPNMALGARVRHQNAFFTVLPYSMSIKSST